MQFGSRANSLGSDNLDLICDPEWLRREGQGRLLSQLLCVVRCGLALHGDLTDAHYNAQVANPAS
jgi:hypothetical protein